MLNESDFNRILQNAEKSKYTSMNNIDFDDCKNVEVLRDCDSLILLQDKSKSPAMIYFATNDFELLVNELANLSGKLRLHFVPREYAVQLASLGFIEWSEYIDFWNSNLADTAAYFTNVGKTEYLGNGACQEASILSQKCKLQSRGFEGESPEWFAEWARENKVIIQRKNSAIIGFCCVSIYNNGTTLWIRMIAVDPSHQGMGVGKQLMEQAICYGVENGAVKGFLAADKLNKNAIHLYEKYNFHAKDAEGELQMVRE